jgi:hypothetical protein
MPKEQTKQKKVKKLKKEPEALTKLLQFLAWLTGVIVSLAVAFGMIEETLQIWFIPAAVTVFFGWVVVVTTLIGVLIAAINHIK